MLMSVDIMHIQHIKYKRGNKTYEQILLRESYRESGAKRSAVKKRTLLNLTKYPPEVVQAIKLALKHKKDLSVLTSLEDINLQQDTSVGGVFALVQLARRMGIEKALGTHQKGKLVLWQIIARTLCQGSRFSAVRMLIMVENAFRTCKTSHLEVRPVLFAKNPIPVAMCWS